MVKFRCLPIIYLCFVLVGCVNSDSTGMIDYPKAAQVRTQLGLAYLESGQLEKAKFNLILAHQYAPDDLSTNLALAHYYITLGDYPRGQYLYQSMLKLYSHDITLLTNYATLMCKLRKEDVANKYFKRVFQLASGYKILASLQNAAICARKTNHSSQARKLASKILIFDPNNHFAHKMLIELALAENKDRVAYRLMQRYRTLVDYKLPLAYEGKYHQLAKQFN
ncbi:hypothetical protein ACXJY6_12825 [Vibrio sp. RC27]